MTTTRTLSEEHELNADELAQLDLRHLWHPFTQMQGYVPQIIVRAEGARMWDIHGKEYIDGFAALWTVNVGHGRQEIADAVAEQMRDLSFFSLFRFSNVPAIKLAAKLAEILPGDLDHVFLTLGGSESNETALKLARQYWRNQGKGSKFKIIYRDRAYHGTTMGVTSAQGLTGNRENFEPLLPGFHRIAAPYCYRCEYKLEYPSCNLACARALEKEIAFHGKSNVAAFLAESIIGTGGVIVPPPEYWPLVREICTQNEVLLLADEVITGFGRTGKMFCMEHWGVVPDTISLAKGISSGYMPMGALGVRDSIYQAFLGPSLDAKGLAAGCTFDGHPACAAAALKNLEIFERENLVEKAARTGAHLQKRLQELYRYDVVGDVRGMGLLADIEIVKDRKTKELFPPDQPVPAKIAAKAYELGVFVRLLAGGYNIAVAPPLVITEAQVDRLVDVLHEAIDGVVAG